MAFEFPGGYGKIGHNRITRIPAKAESVSAAYLTSNSVNDCRMKAGEKPRVRVPSRVGITGGAGTGALSNGKTFGSGQNGRKKLAREMRARRNAR